MYYTLCVRTPPTTADILEELAKWSTARTAPPHSRDESLYPTSPALLGGETRPPWPAATPRCRPRRSILRRGWLHIIGSSENNHRVLACICYQYAALVRACFASEKLTSLSVVNSAGRPRSLCRPPSSTASVDDVLRYYIKCDATKIIEVNGDAIRVFNIVPMWSLRVSNKEKINKR